MKLKDLFPTELEPELKAWLSKFSNANEMFRSRFQLHAKLNGQTILGTVEEGAIIEGAVHIGEGSIVRAHAVLRGPVILGENVVIDSHSVLSGGVFLGSGCKISNGVTITSSISFNHSQIQTGSIIDSTVIGAEVYIAKNCISGTPLCKNQSNLSVDKPATIIGDKTFLSARTTVVQGAIISSHTSSAIGEIIADKS